MRRSLAVAVLGIVGQCPLAGVAWQALHYLEGFRRLGHDPYYVEDTGAWPYDPERKTVTDDCRYAVRYLAKLMSWWGCPERWAYRSPADGRTFGLSESQLALLLGRADLLVNLTGSTVLREEHLRVPARVRLETDPVQAQVEVALGHRATIDRLGTHTHLFTFGENIGKEDYEIPLGPFRHLPTRQPVVLDWWAGDRLPPPARPFTTISNWKQTGKDIEWKGETYLWSKHLEFLKFIDLPRRTPQSLELALALRDPAVTELLNSHGWRVADALALSKEVAPYRDYILGSRGEFTVAKDQYVRPRSGWFSDRSACYLAAGRPVITQDTGFGENLPTGRGLFAFRTMEEILEALDRINADYESHARAAREIAEEHFAAERVLGDLLERAGL